MNGKGDSPRNCFSKQYRTNYDAIFRKPPLTKKHSQLKIRNPTNNMSSIKFNSGQTPASVTNTERKQKAAFLSPFVSTKDLPIKITSFPIGETRFRLCPTFGPADVGMTHDVKYIAVKYRTPEGEITNGKISAGDWFFQKVNPFLIKHYKARFNSKNNPTGDVAFKAKTLVIFWAVVDGFDKDKQPQKQFSLVNLPGRAWAGAPTASIGDDFKSEGRLAKYFDLKTGRVLQAKAWRKDPNDARTKTYEINPVMVPPTDQQIKAATESDQDVPALVQAKPVPFDDYLQYIPESFEKNPPSLSSFVRESSKEEIENCLKATLPADVFEHLMREVQL